jgi:hypothetical protein
MTTYYCSTIEEALKQAKNAGKDPSVSMVGLL